LAPSGRLAVNLLMREQKKSSGVLNAGTMDAADLLGW
jgi:hypothetical protein